MNSTSVIIFDKNGNKVSQTETVHGFDQDTITKEHVASLSRDKKSSLRADNVENIDDINDLQTIESGVKKIKMDN